MGEELLHSGGPFKSLKLQVGDIKIIINFIMFVTALKLHQESNVQLIPSG